MKTASLASVKARLSALVDDVVSTHEQVTVTRNGEPAVVMLSVDDYESMIETLALLDDSVARARLEEAEESLATGDVTTGEEMSALLADRARRETGAA